MSRHVLRRPRASVTACVSAAVLVVAGVGEPARAAAPVMLLSSASGPSGGANTIVATMSSGSATTFLPGLEPTVQFQSTGLGSAACATTVQKVAPITLSGTVTAAGVLTADPVTVRRFSGAKIGFQVPSTAYPLFDEQGNGSTVNPDGLVLSAGQTSSEWNVCVYGGDLSAGGSLLATAKYTLVNRPTITGVGPVGSPTAGGQRITVTGTGFTGLASAPLSGSIGGAALTDIQPTAQGDGFTATTGAREAGSGLELVVKTPGGTIGSLDPDGNGLPEDGDPQTGDTPIPFSYSNGITVTPNSAAVGSTSLMYVVGSGFAELTFDGAGDPTDGNAHVFLVKDAYVPGGNRGVAECGDVQVLSDGELLCTLDLSADRLDPLTSAVQSGTPIDEGAYVLTVVATGETGASLDDAAPTAISSGSTFTVALY